MGLSWEQYIDRAYAQRNQEGGEQVERPSEFLSREGVAFSPDLLIFNGVTILGEVKWAGAASPKDMPTSEATCLPPKCDRWVTQMAAYCHCLETPYFQLLVMYPNRYPADPVLGCWRGESSRRELDDNWSKLMNHAQRAQGDAAVKNATTGGLGRFTKASTTLKPRIIAASYGEVGTLKTSFWLGAPGPILVQSLDWGLEGVIVVCRPEDHLCGGVRCNTAGITQHWKHRQTDRLD